METKELRHDKFIRLQAAIELLKAKADRKAQYGHHILIDEEDISEILLVAGRDEKEIEVI